MFADTPSDKIVRDPDRTDKREIQTGDERSHEVVEECLRSASDEGKCLGGICTFGSIGLSERICTRVPPLRNHVSLTL